ncbi:MAG: class I SAM-dependent rRNA methyltransferase [Deltaproteobacteria bacterium]|nr:class I SAM-dependent rRNA methyltransferase [Deltaproteobacteria bacterium]
MNQSAERLLDGRTAGMPGWTVDRFGPMALIQSFGREDADPSVLAGLVDDLMARDDVQGVVLKERGHQDRGRGEGRLLAGTLPGSSDDDPFVTREGRLLIDEAGMRFGIDLLYGTNVGLFLDARPMRAAVRQRSEGRRVLNLFSYTSAFGVAAALGGARSTTNVDLVPSALKRGQANYRLNGLPHDPRSHTRSDVFEFLRRAAKSGSTWDLVICDPPPVPTAGKGKRRKNFDPARDMERLLRLCVSVLAPGGALLALSATRGTSRFEEPLQAVLEETPDLAEPRAIARAEDFPGEEGLRAVWVERSNDLTGEPQI